MNISTRIVEEAYITVVQDLQVGRGSRRNEVLAKYVKNILVKWVYVGKQTPTLETSEIKLERDKKEICGLKVTRSPTYDKMARMILR